MRYRCGCRNVGTVDRKRFRTRDDAEYSSDSTSLSVYSMKVILDRENPAIPSLCDLYIGANLQEREIFDLLGINFDGHPDLRRIFLWEGFAGHPLRKDFMQMEDANPGLPRFPFEEEGKQER